MSSGWHRLPFLSHPDEIINFDFPHHAVALQRFRSNVPPMISWSQICCNIVTFCMAAILVKYCYTAGGGLLYFMSVRAAHRYGEKVFVKWDYLKLRVRCLLHMCNITVDTIPNPKLRWASKRRQIVVLPGRLHSFGEWVNIWCFSNFCLLVNLYHEAFWLTYQYVKDTGIHAMPTSEKNKVWLDSHLWVNCFSWIGLIICVAGNPHPVKSPSHPVVTELWVVSRGQVVVYICLLQSECHDTILGINLFSQIIPASATDFSVNPSPPSAAYSMNRVSIGSDNGLSPNRHQAIIWTSSGLLSIGPLGTNFSGILIKIKKLFVQENASEYVCEMMAILSWCDVSSADIHHVCKSASVLIDQNNSNCCV